jgi:branched-chain amino acid transport system permease protein
VIGTALAAAAGFLFAVKYTQIQQPAHATWVLLGLKAFVAAVVGGIGNIRGATLGGFLIAFIEQFGAYTGQQIGWDNASAYTDVFVFVLLIVVLLVKPTGIFGSTVREKV